jgi:hypothetical protein
MRLSSGIRFRKWAGRGSRDPFLCSSRKLSGIIDHTGDHGVVAAAALSPNGGLEGKALWREIDTSSE